MTAAKQRGKYHSLTQDEINLVEAAQAVLARNFKRGIRIDSPVDAGVLFQLRIGHSAQEIFTAAFLDTRHRLIAIEDLFYGTIDGCEVHPRIVVQQALNHNAAALMIAHVHPSGNPEPSAADRAITARLKQALGLVDIRLLDHFIVTPSEKPLSLAARGWL